MAKVKETEILLTTKDNPWNPFTQYDDWKYFDEKQHQYNTEAYTARVTGMLDPELTDEQLAHERMKAFKEIIKYNNEIGFDVYVLITRGGKRLNDAPSLYLERYNNQTHPGEGV